MNDDREQFPDLEPDLPEAEDLRFAPPMDAPEAAAMEEALQVPEPEAEAPSMLDDEPFAADPPPLIAGDALTAADDDAAEMAQPVDDAVESFPAESEYDTPADLPAAAAFDALDIDAALAAVSRLDDILAEEEAAELARLAREQADADAVAQRAARLKHPEQFFAMPPLLATQRGRIDSVIPALALIGIGAWLTFALTTSPTPPEPALVLAVCAAGIGLTLLGRWLGAGRWARGALFLALLLLAGAAALYAVSAGPGLVTGWPLLLAVPAVALGAVGLLARPRTPGLLFPAVILIAAALAGFSITSSLIPPDLQTQIAPLWPVAAVVFIAALGLPLLLRRRG